MIERARADTISSVWRVDAIAESLRHPLLGVIDDKRIEFGSARGAAGPPPLRRRPGGHHSSFRAGAILIGAPYPRALGSVVVVDGSHRARLEPATSRSEHRVRRLSLEAQTGYSQRGNSVSIPRWKRANWPACQQATAEPLSCGDVA